jgi:hypothetical protein
MGLPSCAANGYGGIKLGRGTVKGKFVRMTTNIVMAVDCEYRCQRTGKAILRVAGRPCDFEKFG